MRKQALIMLAVMMAGCSVADKLTSITDNVTNEESLYTNDISKLNVTNHDFTILKAAINIEEEKEKKKITGILKYKYPGVYLISLRSTTGIEAARIYLNNDTILVNDRINKKLYQGSSEYLFSKYGISIKILPVILGDYISELNTNLNLSCHNNKTNYTTTLNNNKINYEINCLKRKVEKLKSIDPVSGQGVLLEFSRFEKARELNYARRILIKDISGETTISVEIEKIVNYLEGEIKFIPGKNYEDVILK